MLFLTDFLEWCSVRGVALSTHVWWASFDTDGLCGGFVQVTEEIWVCEKNTITKWEGDIYSYKQQLSHQTRKERAKSIKPWTSSPRCLLLPHASLLEQTSLPSPHVQRGHFFRGGEQFSWGDGGQRKLIERMGLNKDDQYIGNKAGFSWGGGSKENARIKNGSVVGMNTSTFERRGKKKIMTKWRIDKRV